MGVCISIGTQEILSDRGDFTTAYLLSPKEDLYYLYFPKGEVMAYHNGPHGEAPVSQQTEKSDGNT